MTLKIKCSIKTASFLPTYCLIYFGGSELKIKEDTGGHFLHSLLSVGLFSFVFSFLYADIFLLLKKYQAQRMCFLILKMHLRNA